MSSFQYGMKACIFSLIVILLKTCYKSTIQSARKITFFSLCVGADLFVLFWIGESVPNYDFNPKIYVKGDLQ